MSNIKYRPEFEVWLSDKDYQKAALLQFKAEHPGPPTHEADFCVGALQKHLAQKAVGYPDSGAIERPKNKQRDTATYWVSHVLSDPNQRTTWQQQSDQLHSRRSKTNWPTGPRPSISQAKQKPNDLTAVYIFFIFLILYFLFV